MFENFSKLGIGTSNIASYGRSISFDNTKRLLDAALEYNINTLDTADTYGSGDAERLIGKIIKNNRNKFFIISKVGYPYLALPEILSPLNQFGKKIIQIFKKNKRFNKKYILASIEKSLKRLNINCLDSYLLHDFCLNDTIEYSDECFEALYLIKKRGLSKSIGISTNDQKTITYAIDNLDIDLIQTKIIFNKNFNPVSKNKKSKKIKIIVNSILSQRLDNDIDMRFNNLLRIFEIPAEDKKIILITYCLLKKKVDCALFGTTNINHLKLIGLGYKKYQINYSQFFNELDKIFI
ncbi:aldo/keto reductase [Candidatus Pelagibacter ubique]|nr:aldo/keto reductase [Candidatus Pelagibacter ubique]